MTDLTPNDLSHMSDEDFNALCPQGHHALGAEPLSPAAQAVLDAFWEGLGCGDDWDNANLAAALRAAVGFVVPEENAMPFNLAHRVRWDAEQSVRLRLLAIAAELEGQ